MKQKAEHSKIFRPFLKQYILPRKGTILFLILIIGVTVVFGNLNPYIYGKMIDSINAFDMKTLISLAILYFLITILGTAIGILEGYIGQKVTFEISSHVRKDLFQKMVGMKTEEVQKYTTGELVSRLNGDAEAIVDFYLDILTNAIQILISLVISIFFVVTISLRLSTVALFYLPATFAITFCSRKFFKRLAEEGKKLGDQYSSYQTQVFSNNSGIKSFHLEQKMSQRFAGFIGRQFALMKKRICFQSGLQLLSTAVTVLSSLFLLVYSGFLIQDGLLTLGLMVSFNTYINKLFSTVSQLWSFNISSQEIRVSLDRVNSILEKQEEYQNDCQKKSLDTIQTLSFSHVDFAYQEGLDVLSDLSMQIQIPGFYGIVGTNGCGKSTLAKLLTRMYQPSSGEILLNQNDSAEIKLADLRSRITYIQKEDFFLKDTIEENLRIAAPDASLQKIIQACQQAGIAPYIDSLPEKYQTIIEENGSSLSSGQKQKLNLARAILRDSDVLLLDEVTANLDGAAEKEILAVLKEISRHKIVLLISHKISSLIDCDWIYLIQDGAVAADGTPSQLLENNQMFQNLFAQKRSEESV